MVGLGVLVSDLPISNSSQAVCLSNDFALGTETRFVVPSALSLDPSA